MTPEEKAKRFDEALAMAKECITYIPDDAVKKYMLSIFPELKESKDEEIRKAILNYLKKMWGNCKDNVCGVHVEDAIAWLEKQKEFVSADFDDVWETADCDELTAPLEKYSKDAIKEMCHAWYDKGIELERKSWLEKQGEKKTVNDTDEDIVEAVKGTSILDMVEPKFHEGDWIISNNKKSAYQVIEVKRGIYVIRDNADNHEYHIGIEECEKSGRLWKISDAKFGDVLYSKKHNLLWIYKNADESVSCLNLNYNSSNISIGTDIVMPNDTCPATKEQRETLMKAMVDTRYTFDFEKKKLKRIEYEIEIPFGAKDSELHEVSYYIPNGFHAEIDGDEVVIKKGEKPTAWSEEDEHKVKDTIYFLESARKHYASTVEIDACVEWLKSLQTKNRRINLWKQ